MGLFDFNNDGKTSLDEEILGNIILRQAAKNARSKRDSSYSPPEPHSPSVSWGVIGMAAILLLIDLVSLYIAGM